MINSLRLVFSIIVLAGISSSSYSQRLVEYYEPAKQDSIRVGTGEDDLLPFIQRGYTLLLPGKGTGKGVLIFLEDSFYDKKNGISSQLYTQALANDLAVLSVSTEIPLDFYFSESSLSAAHELIQHAFDKHKLPNDNVFFLGPSLAGHRALRYIKFMQEGGLTFQLDVAGIVICNFTLDWTRKWHQHERDIRINRIDLWEPTFINYMLETHLSGTPEHAPDNYHDFSPYSYFDQANRNIKIYKNYAVRAYIEPAIKYRLEEYTRTLYENNATDIVGFLAELKLAGNDNTELVVLRGQKAQKKKSATSTWSSVDKEELMNWIEQQIQK